jgi:hypothetical protein
MRYLFFAIALFIATFCVTFFGIKAIRYAVAHDAPASRKQPYGWRFDTVCCNTTDCRQLSNDEVEETDTGYIWRSKHSGATHVYTRDETLGDGTGRIRRSQDEFYHGCESNPTIGADGAVIVPARKLCFYETNKGI